MMLDAYAVMPDSATMYTTTLPGHYTMPQNAKIGGFSIPWRQIPCSPVTEHLTDTHDLFQRIVEVWCKA